jgi:hypothetical protein
MKIRILLARTVFNENGIPCQALTTIYADSPTWLPVDDSNWHVVGCEEVKEEGPYDH